MCAKIISPSYGVIQCLSVCFAIAAFVMEQPVAGAMPPAVGAGTAILRATQQHLIKTGKKKAPKAPKQVTERETAGIALQNSQAALASEKDQLREAQAMMRDAAKELRDFEDELERAEPEDSPLARAKARFEAAQKDNAKAEERMHQSPEYRAALEKLAPDSARRAEELANLHASMVSGDERASLAAKELSEARQEYEPLRNKLLESDSGWRDAVDKLKEMRKLQSAAEAEVRNARAAKNLVEDRIERAQREARLAEIRKQQAQMQQRYLAQLQKARQAQSRRNYRSHPRHR